jgi:peptide/nickel transport system ATP-binding protein
LTLLNVKHLQTYFQTSKGLYKAVDGASFDLDHGEALGLVGESGCGKTTCALSITRLLPKEGKIYGGEIRLEGTDLVPLSDEEIRSRRWKDVSIIFQGSMNALNPVMKVGDQIAEVIVLHEKISMKEALVRAGELFELVELPVERINNYPHEFSGGMKQRAMIAIALACNPKIVIGDEPTTGLDVMVQAQILNLLEKLRKELNMGLILITHDLSILAETCDRIAVMYAGKIVEIGTVEDIFEHTAHPYTERLIACFPNIGKSKVIPPSIDGIPPNMMEPIRGCSFSPRCHMAIPLCAEQEPALVKLGEKHYASCHRIGEASNDY